MNIIKLKNNFYDFFKEVSELFLTSGSSSFTFNCTMQSMKVDLGLIPNKIGCDASSAIRTQFTF